MAKKSFKDTQAALDFADNPAMAFISGDQPENRPDTGNKKIYDGRQPIGPAPDGYKLNPMYVEKKTKRVQLLLQPSVFEKAKAAADLQGISFNEFCHIALQAALDAEQED